MKIKTSELRQIIKEEVDNYVQKKESYLDSTEEIKEISNRFFGTETNKSKDISESEFENYLAEAYNSGKNSVLH